MRILVTGGAGYIGSHTIVELIAAGHEPIVIDNFSNSSPDAIERVEALSGKAITYYEGNVADAELLEKIFSEHAIEAIIHFAAFKAVGESVEKPLLYYRNNVSNFVELLSVATKHGVKQVVFSSTAAVYGDAQEMIVTEDTSCAPQSPYGWSKYMDEQILHDTCKATTGFHGTVLRYFNVVGAHPSGKLGESPRGVPQNLLPLIVRATEGTLPPLTVLGTDYNTPDGTCLRDYIHVVDLAKAHVAALEHAGEQQFHIYNVGTGTPTSVLELISTFEKVTGKQVPHTLGARRPGDPVAYYASPKRANEELNWKAEKTIEDACRDAWRWQENQK